MAKKNKSKKDIIKAYMDYVLEHSNTPESVFKFGKDNGFTEAEFYNFFGTFKSVENSIFNDFFENTINLLEKNREYKEFDAQNKLLSFYFTFFEVLKANRSYVIMTLSRRKPSLKTPGVLVGLKEAFKEYIDGLDIDTLDLKQEKLEEVKQKGLSELSWQQLLFTINFWMDDNSASFEKTDIFIEKSIKTSFELMNIAPLKSLLDLGKFFVKEKVMRKN
ncbi:MAG: heat-shock protein [Flammeovirgaceae bacterium]|nr:heat-shock protein [Flammeovirgaceae bacterium]